MTKIQFLKIFLIIVAVLMISVTSYGAWKILKDIDTDTEDLAELNIPPKTENVITEPEIDTLDWKVYQNEEYGFEFKYDKNWNWEIDKEYCQRFSCVYRASFFDVRAEKENYNPQSPSEVKTEYVSPPNIIIYKDLTIREMLEADVHDAESWWSMEKLMSWRYSQCSFAKMETLSDREATTALKVKRCTNGPWVSGNYIIFKKGDYLFRFSNGNYDSLNQTLSTFKFIEIDETAG